MSITRYYTNYTDGPYSPGQRMEWYSILVKERDMFQGCEPPFLRVPDQHAR